MINHAVRLWRDRTTAFPLDLFSRYGDWKFCGI